MGSLIGLGLRRGFRAGGTGLRLPGCVMDAHRQCKACCANLTLSVYLSHTLLFFEFIDLDGILPFSIKRFD